MKAATKARLILCMLLALLFALFLKHEVLVHMDDLLKDRFFLFNKKEPIDSRVVIVDIDEYSISRDFSWPWKRDKLAMLLDKLQNAAAIGMDVFFPDDDRIAQALGMDSSCLADINTGLINPDCTFAQAIEDSQAILGMAFYFHEGDDSKGDEEVLGFSDNLALQRYSVERTGFIDKISMKISPKQGGLNTARQLVYSTPLLRSKSWGNAFVNADTSSDARLRSAYIALGFEDSDGFSFLAPSLSLAMYAKYKNAGEIAILEDEQGIFGIQVADLFLPTDEFGSLKIRYKNALQKDYQYLRASEILDGKYDGFFDGKLVLVGTSAVGANDIRSTPIESFLPGVQVHAALLDNMLEEHFIKSPIYRDLIDFSTLFLIAVFCFLILSVERYLTQFLAMLALFLGFLYLHYSLMLGSLGLVFTTFAPLMCSVLIFFLGIFLNYYFEGRQKELLRQKFASKVSAQVVNELINSESSDALVAKEREISIFFSDIRDFTSISEKLNPARLVQMLNEYLTPMSEVIIEKGGTIDKFIGDAVMAYFNAPGELQAHADAALEAAIEQIKRLEELNKSLIEQGFSPLNIGIGINTALCVVGEMGSVQRSDYTCIGDGVNLASRIEGLCKEYRANILISEFSLAKLKDPARYELKSVGFCKVKGKEQEVELFRCFGFKGEHLDLWSKLALS